MPILLTSETVGAPAAELLPGETAQQLTPGLSVARLCLGFYMPLGGQLTYLPGGSSNPRSIQGMTPNFVVRDPVRRLISSSSPVWGIFASVLRGGVVPPEPTVPSPGLPIILTWQASHTTIAWSIIGAGHAGGIFQYSPMSDFSSGVATIREWANGEGSPFTASGALTGLAPSTAYYARAASRYGPGGSLQTPYAANSTITGGAISPTGYGFTCSGLSGGHFVATIGQLFTSTGMN